ncbi:MAG TPA: hypothetical protein VFR11_05830 [Micromonosporaceae bacterium]|nr:hypothetical protein [Micromonosporaceae bacterium]
MRALYQGQATIARRDGSYVPVEVTVWSDDAGSHTTWGGRAVVRPPHTLRNDQGDVCLLRWPVHDRGYMVGQCVPSSGQLESAAETYRLVGVGEPTHRASEQ